MKDLLNNIDVKRVISPVSVSDTTAQVGQIIDRKGFDGLTYLIATGSIADADATFTVLLEEGDASNLSDAAAVADADLIGTEALAGFQFDDDNECRKLGYKGSKRYTRLTITPVANASAAVLAAVAVLSSPQIAPTANPGLTPGHYVKSPPREGFFHRTRMKFKVITAVATEPITRAEAKLHLGLDDMSGSHP